MGGFKNMNSIFNVIKQKIRKKLFKIIKPELNRQISEIYQIIPQLIDYYNAPPPEEAVLLSERRIP